MNNLTGFIVEVRPRGNSPAKYMGDGRCLELLPGEVFVGYCWSETDLQDDGSFAKVLIIETHLVDSEKRLFEYGRKAVFNARDVVMNIRALRGPERNVSLMSKSVRKRYEVWDQVQKTSIHQPINVTSGDEY